MKMTEASLNGFPSKDIVDQIETDPYRFLICADKFQTGYDQPLLHSMYVDKALSASRRFKRCPGSIGRTLKSTTPSFWIS